jgi:SH3-like domain-containing protein
MLQWQGFKVVEPKTKYTNNPADSYEAPIDGAKVNFTFDKGIEISVTKVNDNWSFVKDTNSKSGFIKKEFITDKKP